MKKFVKGKIFSYMVLLGFLFFINFYQDARIDLVSEENRNSIYRIKNSYNSAKICLSFSEYQKGKDLIKQGCIFEKNSNLIVHNYAKVMLSSLHFVENPKKILILGMGIGTLSKTLAEILPESQIDVVDINSNLLEINKKYFDFDIEKYKNVFFYHEDAFEYLKNLNKEIKYDIIIGDVFDKQYIPEKFLTNEYMQMIKNAMSENGIFSNNSFANSKTRMLEDKLIKDNFGKKYLVYRNSEIIIFTNKDNEKFPLKEVQKTDENHIRFQEVFKKYGINSDEILRKIKLNNK
jgi:hypothetical protein